MYMIWINYAGREDYLVGRTTREDTMLYVLDTLKKRGYAPQVFFLPAAK